jgi:putative FmdB family regulatory protein
MLPTYIYECSACNERFEVQQRITDDPIRFCAKCGKEGTIKRVISGTLFVLKGLGWAKDGYSSAPPGSRKR